MSLVASTGDVPQGTLLNVPSAPPTGDPGKAPVVAANTVNRWKDPIFLLLVISASGSTLSAITEVMPSTGDINWRITLPKIIFAILNGIGAILRAQINTVTR